MHFTNKSGVIVSSPGATLPARVTLTGAASLVTPGAPGGVTRSVALASGGVLDTVAVTVEAGGQQEVRFKFTARAVRALRGLFLYIELTHSAAFRATDCTVAACLLVSEFAGPPHPPLLLTHCTQNTTMQQVGNATLRFVATAGSGAAAVRDALEVVLPVLGRQGSVFVATSFALRPNGTRCANDVAAQWGSRQSCRLHQRQTCYFNASGLSAVFTLQRLHLQHHARGGPGATQSRGRRRLPGPYRRRRLPAIDHGELKSSVHMSVS